MILVTGASGVAGGAVLRELLSRGTKSLRAMYRGEKDRFAAPAGVEAVQGDFADSPSLGRALAGVDAAYLVCAPVQELAELETNFLLACQTARVGHLVINSALGAGDFPKSFPSWHRKVEDKARELRIPFTILRPNGFMQNISTYFAPTIKTQDSFYGTIGQAKVSLIDVRDVGAAAATALTSTRTVGQVFELSGPEAVSYEELASRISKVAGRSIRHVNLSPDQMRAGMTSAGVPPWQATAPLELDEYYRGGKGAASDAALRGLLTSAPRTLENYLIETAPQFAKSPDA